MDILRFDRNNVSCIRAGGSKHQCRQCCFDFCVYPVFSALLSFLILSEQPNRQLLLTSCFVFVGLAIIGLGSSGGTTPHWIGDLWAVYIVIAFSGIDPATATKTYIHVAGDPHWIHWRGLRNVLVYRFI